MEPQERTLDPLGLQFRAERRPEQCFGPVGTAGAARRERRGVSARVASLHALTGGGAKAARERAQRRNSPFEREEGIKL